MRGRYRRIRTREKRTQWNVQDDGGFALSGQEVRGGTAYGNDDTKAAYVGGASAGTVVFWDIQPKTESLATRNNAKKDE